MSDFRLFLNKVLANTFIAMRESREILGIFFFCFFPFFLKKKEKKDVYILSTLGQRLVNGVPLVIRIVGLFWQTARL